jgi:hypothetical protein
MITKYMVYQGLGYMFERTVDLFIAVNLRDK